MKKLTAKAKAFYEDHEDFLINVGFYSLGVVTSVLGAYAGYKIRSLQSDDTRSYNQKLVEDRETNEAIVLYSDDGKPMIFTKNDE